MGLASLAPYRSDARQNVRSIVLICSKDDTDATVRLQSGALLNALKLIPGVSVRGTVPHPDARIDPDACVVFHFDDLPAIEFLRECRQKQQRFLAACFGSDIYDFSRYLASYGVADLYLMPTELHRSVLASQFYKPVYLLPEGLDPIAMDDQAVPPCFPSRNSRRLLWFGYPESFKKGMASLLPVIDLHLRTAAIDEFTLILNEAEFTNEFGLKTIPFSKDSFRNEASVFDYCILSHLPLDLSLNSYIKSPNKLITCLMTGIIPICSDTPNYRALLHEFGLDRFLFGSPAQLDKILTNLDPLKDSDEVISSGIVEALYTRFSPLRLAEQFLATLAEFEAASSELPEALRQLSPRFASSPKQQPDVYFSEHIRDLLPSFLRAVRSRMPH